MSSLCQYQTECLVKMLGKISKLDDRVSKISDKYDQQMVSIRVQTIMNSIIPLTLFICVIYLYYKIKRFYGFINSYGITNGYIKMLLDYGFDVMNGKLSGNGHQANHGVTPTLGSSGNQLLDRQDINTFIDQNHLCVRNAPFLDVVDHEVSMVEFGQSVTYFDILSTGDDEPLNYKVDATGWKIETI